MTTHHKTVSRGASRDDFELVATASTSADPPWPHAARHTHDTERAVEKHDVDRKTHAHGMDAAERIGEQQTNARLEGVATEESAGTTRTECGHDLDCAEQHRIACRIDDLEHGTILQ